jgi:hypothetical protein
MLTLLVGREILQTLVYYKGMAADVLALGSLEVPLSEIAEGTVGALRTPPANNHPIQSNFRPRR